MATVAQANTPKQATATASSIYLSTLLTGSMLAAPDPTELWLMLSSASSRENGVRRDTGRHATARLPLAGLGEEFLHDN